MKKFLAVLFAALLALAACGDDDDDGGDAAADDTTADDTPTDDGAGSDDSGSDDSGSDDVGDAAAFLGDEDCNFILAGTALNPLSALQPGSDGDIDSAADQLQEIAAAAPDEIRGDMQLVADRYSEFLDVIGAVDLSDPSSFQDPAVQGALQEAQTIFDDDFEAASEAVSDYFDENCPT